MTGTSTINGTKLRRIAWPAVRIGMRLYRRDRFGRTHQLGTVIGIEYSKGCCWPSRIVCELDRQRRRYRQCNRLWREIDA